MADSKLKNVIDVCALLIAAGALIYSIYQHNQSVQIQKSQTERAILLENEKVKPYLQLLFRKADSEPQKGILINNVGAGPAKIVSFNYFKNEKAYENRQSYTSWVDENRYLIFTKDTLVFDELNVLPYGFIIPSGQDNEIYLLKETNPIFYDTQARRDMEKLIIEIEYKSLSPLDSTTYYLRFCEKFLTNNIRKKDSTHIYEK